ncbi:MAG: xanthine dehydrogenase family protein molybdopterin-binding subunit [Betaproteobacteria bacterium]|nr:MAG: xanthine dehydrogenase family protein molybdopterin-binding subunit [Betaproteobacteria bacterium]
MKNTTSSKSVNISRRQFLVGSAAAGGGLALGFHLPFGVSTAVAAQGDGVAEINAWVVVKPDDTCVIRFVRAEMGQGTRTGLAQLIAEELGCDWSKVTTESITAGQNLARKRVWRVMSTAGSRGIRESQDYVRRGGAAARMMLLQAAANQWQVPVGEVSVTAGVITHAGSGRSTTYGKVAAAAAKIAPPDEKSIVLKNHTDWKIAGKPLRRLDTAAKLNGSQVYGIDLKLPGMLHATVKDCPVYGGKLVSFDESKVAGMPGVKRVLRVNDSTVAVVADTWWRAKKALDALPIVWDEGPNAKVNSASIAEHLKSGLTSNDAFADINTGDAPKAIAASAKKIEAVYSVPFTSHTTMEPMNCTVKLGADKAEIWIPTQNAEASLAALSSSSGLPLDKCEVYGLDLGGGFGRRIGNQDVVRQGVAIAKAFPGTPVKMVWSREEDQAHDFYRPIAQARLAAGVDDGGNLTGLHIRVSGQSINAFANPAAIKDGKDRRQLQGLWPQPHDAQIGYTHANLRTEYAMRNTHLPVGPWRGVNTNQNGIFLECFMDEVAKLAGKDPLEFRRSLMSERPKHLGVLNAAAEKAGWGKPLPKGVHRGIAQFMGYGSYSAAVAEVSVSSKGEVKVHRCVFALDCGNVVNPDQVAAQIEGSVAYGMTTLHSEISVANGRVVETNFHNFRVMQIAEMPKVEVVLPLTRDFWGGVGEPTICVVVPAILNAIHAATGKPVRSLPLGKQGLTLV